MRWLLVWGALAGLTGVSAASCDGTHGGSLGDPGSATGTGGGSGSGSASGTGSSSGGSTSGSSSSSGSSSGSTSSGTSSGSSTSSTSGGVDAGTDAPAGPGGTGAPCMVSTECDSGICEPLEGGTREVCTTSCSATTPSCIAGWTCGPQPGQSSDICLCTPMPETCNGYDDNCNGIVDEQPAANQDCVTRYGAGHVCAGGCCVCLPDAGACGLSSSSGGGCLNAPYAQCGGTCWTGSRCCPTGYACTYQSTFYSQCTPSDGG
jgi:hypothetical protein